MSLNFWKAPLFYFSLKLEGFLAEKDVGRNNSILYDHILCFLVKKLKASVFILVFFIIIFQLLLLSNLLPLFSSFI